MATSTALRFRNRSQSDSAVLGDSAANIAGLVDRTLTDSLSLWDAGFTISERREPGDRIVNVSDSDTELPAVKNRVVNNTTFPYIADTGTYQNDGAFTHYGNHPNTVTRGQLLLYFVSINQPLGYDTSFTVSGVDNLVGPLNSNQFYPLTDSPPYFLYTQVLYKIADGSEAGTTFTITPSQTNSATECVAKVFAISNWSDDYLPSVPTSSYTSWASPLNQVGYALPTPNPGFTGNYMWMYLTTLAKQSGVGMPTVTDWTLNWPTGAPDNQLELYSDVAAQSSSAIGQMSATGNHGSTTAVPNSDQLSGYVFWTSFVVGITNGETGEFISVNDSLVIEKSKSPILSDSFVVRDLPSLTDRDLSRFRVLSDSFDLADDFTKSITFPESSVTTNVNTFDSVAVNDSVIAEYNSIVVNFKTLTDSITATDKIVPNSVVLNDVALADSIVVADSKRVTITRTIAYIINARVKKSTAVVTDSATATFTGIVNKTLTDSATVTEITFADYEKSYFDSAVATDDSIELRQRFRENSDSFAVRDNMIVTRSFIDNEVIASDTITFFDQALPTFVSGQPVTADILHGVELY
jgi:hypothetical protein